MKKFIMFFGAFSVPFLIIINFSFLSAQVLLNEFMIDPDNDNTGEFIEIFNAGDSLIEMSLLFLCDAQDTDAITPFPDSLLYPGQYGLILDPDYSGEYDLLIPDSIPRFTIPDSRFGMYGISNSTSKPFSLLSSDHKILDSYITGSPDWPVNGYTIERIRWQDSLWQTSLSVGGSPGFRNSVSAKGLDMEISSFLCDILDGHLCISFFIINMGLENISEYSYGYIVDISRQVPVMNDTVIFTADSIVEPGDSLFVFLEYDYHSKGAMSIHVFTTCGDNICDTLSLDINIPLYEDELIVSEFVCKTGDNFSSEYIEVFSRCPLAVQTKGLIVADMTGQIILGSDYILYPDSMLVLVQSASFYDDFPYVYNSLIPPAWRSLNNSEDIICLQNPSGSNICNLHYDAVWNIAPDCAMQLVDTALNYRDPNNWEISYSGSPGENNISEKQLFHISCHLPLEFFTPLDTLYFLIINDGYFALSEKQICLHTPMADQLFILPESEPGDTIYFYPDTLNIFQQGTQICSLSSEPYFNLVFKYYYPRPESPCSFNELLFEPMDTYGQVEFIELFCLSDNLDLDHWQLKVNNSNIPLEGILVNTYNVFCDIDDPVGGLASSSVYTFQNFPSLPNGGADCYLFDPMGNIADHCDLREHDDLNMGKSLEKKFSGIPSNDPDIWFSSVSASGATPGRQNSITALPGLRNDLDIYPVIFSPGTDERIQFSIDSESDLSFCELLCFNMAGQLIYQKEQALFSQPACLIFWDGKTEGGDFPARGIYLALVVLHDIGGNTFKLRDTFVIK
ncbi:MAG: lamin tail domain-containing protein [Candidatus Marinimicrobia bacterium]|nr:lamin tail domain-containing protein [Candidatus Neomarinimicrobiota bacterium]